LSSENGGFDIGNISQKGFQGLGKLGRLDYLLGASLGFGENWEEELKAQIIPGRNFLIPG